MNILILTIVLILAIASLVAKKSMSAMLSFASMMLLLGFYYISLHLQLLGLFQIFVYTGGVTVLMLFGLTIIGSEFPKISPKYSSAIVSTLLFISMTLLYFRFKDGIVHYIDIPKGLSFADKYSDLLPIFAMIAVSLIYASVAMAGKLSKSKKDIQ